MVDPSQLGVAPGGAPTGPPGMAGPPSAPPGPDPLAALNALRMLGRHGKKRARSGHKRRKGK